MFMHCMIKQGEYMSNLLDRFLRYVEIDTQSNPESDTFPSTKEKQLPFLKMLYNELKEMGVSEVKMDEYGYVTGIVPANKTDSKVKLGFLAHIDTSSAVCGSNVKPRVVKNYDGGDIQLNESRVLSPSVYSSMNKYIGCDLIVTDGNTLLGADDKAGVAEIMEMIKYFLQNKDIPHCEIRVAFTPDEEVGRGMDFFDAQEFGADYAYTVDGGGLGELEYENFNAAAMSIKVHGCSIHPGYSKGLMKNAVEVLMDFHSLLPSFDKPCNTEGYEGFYHIDNMKGCVQEASAEYIIRDHDAEKFALKKKYAQKAADFINEKYGNGTLEISISDQYTNMKEIVEKHMHLIENAKISMEELGIVPQVIPIRGGTDGARLSYMGIPCPNICTGAYNYHGYYEYIPYQSMEKVVLLLEKIVEKYTINH